MSVQYTCVKTSSMLSYDAIIAIIQCLHCYHSIPWLLSINNMVAIMQYEALLPQTTPTFSKSTIIGTPGLEKHATDAFSRLLSTRCTRDVPILCVTCSSNVIGTTAVQYCGGLLQVSFDAPMSKANRWTFLHNMHRSNVVLWPAYAHDPSFAVIDSTFVVIQHTVTERDNEKEDPDDVVEEGDDDVHAEDGSESDY